MNDTLRWTKFESVMTAVFDVKAITAPKFNRFDNDHISMFEIS